MRILCVALLVACGDGKAVEPTEPAKSDPRLAMDLPKMSAGYLPYVEAPTSVIVSPTAIVMDGTSIVAVRDGVVDPQELEGGRLGMKIEKLARFTKATIESTKADRAALLFDRNTPYRLMVSVMFSMKSDGMLKRFELVGTSGGKLVSVPIVLPDKRPASFTVVGGRQPGDDLMAQLAGVKEQGAQVKVGSASVLDAKLAPASTLTTDQVKAKIVSAYARGLRRCAGKDDRSRIRVPVEVTIDRTGRMTKPKIKAKPAVASCLEGLLVTWRWPVPKDADGEPIEVALSMTLEIEPMFADVEPGPPTNADALRGDMAIRGGADLEPLPAPAPEDRPLGMFVSITKDQMLVWSISQLEGTLREPLKRLSLKEPNAIAQLTEVLTGVIERRWSGKPRSPDTLSIVIQADSATTVQWVAEVIGAVRKTKDGKDLFPDIQLSTGFE
jgi:biopolymer transport protein ExbD